MNQQLKERFLTAKKALFDKKYSFLNDKQRQAVFTVNGPLLVLAGAGSGKTTVLVQRIAYILKYGNAYFNNDVPENLLIEQYIDKLEQIAKSENTDSDTLETALMTFKTNPPSPFSILAITFTNKAANEMKERLEKILGEDGKNIVTGTFHSVCARILRKHITKMGYNSDFTIYDTDDQKKLITSCLKELNIDDKKFPPKAVLGEISRSKDKLIDSVSYNLSAGKDDFRAVTIGKIYTLYESKKKEANALDFDDLIFITVKLLESEDDIREAYKSRFKYLSVDEYQDTNKAQFRLCELLCPDERNIMVVGDDDQSIYKFRGATIKNILSFDKSFEDAKVIKLEQNYRSKGNILNAANEIIKNNRTRKGKTLWTSNDDGEKIHIRRCDDQLDEAQYIVDKIGQLVKDNGYGFGDFAILYRMNSQSNALEQVFAKSGFPYRILGGTRFYDRKEIKDIIAYMCVVNNPNDSVRLKRIINVPKRGIGDTTVSEIEAIAAREGKNMLEICRTASGYEELKRASAKLCAFGEMIEEIRATKDTLTVAQTLEKVLYKTAYTDVLSESPEDKDRIENIKELKSNAIQYDEKNENPTLGGFLEEVALISDIDNYDENSPAVVMMTVHSSKGLEFPVVFLPGMEENIFPGSQSTESESELEEERRLCYVAVTRAKKQLFVVHCNHRMIFGKTDCNRISRFVDEIPKELCEFENSYLERKPQSFNYSRLDEFSSYARSFGSRTNQSKNTISSSYSKPTTQNTEPAKIFVIGDRVNHKMFGAGTVLSSKPMGGDVLYEIAFDSIGTKKLMGNYAKLTEAL